MGRRRISRQTRRGRKGKREVKEVAHIDYYERAFALFHSDLNSIGYSSEAAHPLRKRFWTLLPPRTYEPMAARSLLLQYLQSAEREMDRIISQHSLAYWLHIYRRIAPHSIGLDKQPYTIGIVRATLEAAIQKYGLLEPCDAVGISGQVPIDSIFSGLLIHPDFRLERQVVEQAKQLVLTNFTTANLKEFYDLEKLAYEVWRTGAALRIVGKGAPLIVDDSEWGFIDGRSEELNTLVTHFDRRHAAMKSPDTSATGMIFGWEAIARNPPGSIFLPTYNLGHLSSDHFSAMFEDVFGFRFSGPVTFNFIWFPFSLREFRLAHVPFADGFRTKYGIQLDAVLLTIAALAERVWDRWVRTRGTAIVRDWQRAYEGPRPRDALLAEVEQYLPVAAKRLGISPQEMQLLVWREGVEFLTLSPGTRATLDVAYPGPHATFLPFGSQHLFVDFAWIFRRLYSLFTGVRVDDQNFKGEALERIVRFQKSVLPVKPCRAGQERRQIDAAFEIGKRLIIIESKAVGWSIGFDRGQPEAIRFRIGVFDNALEEVDDKAQWLSKHPIGDNYDISRFDEILPIVVSPFVEFIPSLSSRYWLRDELPRILTPGEFKEALENKSLLSVAANIVPVSVRHGWKTSW